MTVENLRLWLSALTTPFIAVLGVWIAYQQFRLQGYRFRFDVSERRLAIFFAVRELLEKTLAVRRPDDQAWVKFTVETAGASFLFGPDVTDFLDRLRESYLKVAEVSYIEADGDLADHGNGRLLEERRNEKQWMREQLKNAERVFRPYLDLSAA